MQLHVRNDHWILRVSAGPSTLQRLRQATDAADLALVLRVSKKFISYAAYTIPDAARYTTFEVPKASGGSRIIHKPHEGLRILQARLNVVLTACLEEIEAAHGETRPVSHAFRAGRSIYTNARRHTRRRYVFNIDLQDFFPSIHFGRVRGFFLRSADFELNPEVAHLIASIATAKVVGGSILPQGAPSSPVISNLLARPLDVRLRKVARQRGCRYTRYADDITFSTNAATFPESIACTLPGAHDWQVGARVQGAISSAGFEVNPAKTRMQYNGARQMVTGLVVNKHLNVERLSYKALRAATQRIWLTDTCDGTHPSLASLQSVPVDRLLHSIEGRLNHLYRTQREAQIELPSASELTGVSLLYSRFIHYRRFFAQSKPLVITEGPTDIIYLKLAWRDWVHRTTGAPPPKVDELAVQFLRITTKIKQLTGLDEGSDHLRRFMENYEKRMAPMKGRTPAHPVIVLGDNDKGADPIIGAYRKRTKDSRSLADLRKEPLLHFASNLYVVLTPLSATGAYTTIEDFLDPSATASSLGTKTFHPGGKGFDTVKHFGKKLLAERVVKPKAALFTFDGFDPIIERVNEACAAYHASAITPASSA